MDMNDVELAAVEETGAQPEAPKPVEVAVDNEDPWGCFGDAISWLCSEFKDRSDPENVKLKMGHMFHTDKDLFVQGTTEQKTKGGKEFWSVQMNTQADGAGIQIVATCWNAQTFAKIEKAFHDDTPIRPSGPANDPKLRSKLGPNGELWFAPQLTIWKVF